jgi:uncharacterized protein (UPF0305 family)
MLNDAAVRRKSWRRGWDSVRRPSRLSTIYAEIVPREPLDPLKTLGPGTFQVQ